MKSLLAVFAVATLLTGCASSSGILNAGNGMYTVTTSASPARGGVTGARQAAYEAAAKHCAKPVVVSETGAAPTWTDGMAHATITFRCDQG